MTDDELIFNPPPGWPKPPDGWRPPAQWAPDPSWPAPPNGWNLWLPKQSSATPEPVVSMEHPSPQPTFDEPPDQNPPSSLESRLTLLESENAALRAKLNAQGEDVEELVELDDEKILQSVGIYRYHHPLENAVAYREELQQLGVQIANLVKADLAIERSTMFTFDNSLSKGRRMSTDLAKLMLRAYNAEADNSIRALRLGNVVTAKRRIEASRTAIAKLGRMMEMRISDAFHELRLREIELTADWLIKKQEEREAAKEERARLREEQRVERELAEERVQLDKERSHIENALVSLREAGEEDLDLEASLQAIDEAIAQNDYRLANIRAGYVYVISNRGAFGSNVVKIGLTRRLEPLKRIAELSGASVPFRFDIHALFFSEDAVSLERELHEHFAEMALNQANSRKEFFFATPAQVRDVLVEKVGNLLEFTEGAAATEYLQSVRHWPEGVTKLTDSSGVEF
jgi:hypothetical protein